MKNGMGVTVPGTGTTGLVIAAAVGALVATLMPNLKYLKT
jgi:L-cysteine desulfidase